MSRSATVRVLSLCLALVTLASGRDISGISAQTVPDASAADVRALWVTRSTLTSPEAITQMVRSAQAGGFNTLLVQVRGRGDAYFAGTIEPRKSQASLARAFARVADRHPEALLALVGQLDEQWTAPYVDGLAQHLERAGMAERVLVTPLTPEPFEWHVASDVLVCASDNESLPRVILEAMAFETLVVSTDIFGIPEVVEDGVTGFLCRSRDEHELAEKLSDVLDRQADHRHIAAAGS